MASLKQRFYELRRGALFTLARSAPAFWGKQVRRPLLIIGDARSGTTILTRLIAAHPDVANWSEANMVWAPTGWRWSASERETPPLWVDPHAFIARWQRDAAGRQAEIRAVFGAFQAVRRRALLMNKAPHNLWRIPYLLEVFPEAKLIHIVRDGRAVVYSKVVRLWPHMEADPELHERLGLVYTFDELCERMGAFWRENLEEVARQSEAHGLTANGTLLELRYEDLCADPTGTLNRVGDHIGLADFPPPQQPVENRNFKWQQALEEGTITRMTAAMQPALSAWGYL